MQARRLAEHKLSMCEPASCVQVHRPCTTLVSDYRPVPLTWLYCNQGDNDRAKLSPLLDQPPAAEPDPEAMLLPRKRMSADLRAATSA